MPLADALLPLFDEGGLVRGRVISCTGVASLSIASVVVRDALVAGSWMAVVDVDSFGADAACELGIPLERVVRIQSTPESGSGQEHLDHERRWIDVMGAAVDGFDIVVTRMPAGLRGDHRPASVRKLMSRLVQRGAVVVTIEEAGALACDVHLTTRQMAWEGLEDGAGHLRRRRVDVVAGGRRVPGRRSCRLTLTGSAQRVEISTVVESGGEAPNDSTDVAAQLAG